MTTATKTASVLTDREKEVLHWSAEGKSGPEIAIILGIAHQTVKNQLHLITHKLDAANTTNAVAIAIRAGLIQ